MNPTSPPQVLEIGHDGILRFVADSIINLTDSIESKVMDNTRTPLGKLPWEDAMKIYQAKHEGKPIEFWGVNAWLRSEVPQYSLNLELIYRIALTKPSVNWSHVSKEFVCMATDESGKTFCYTRSPSSVGSEWINGGVHCLMTSFASFKAGTCDWKDSLVMRPEGE